MLGKLLKHDFKSLLRRIWPAFPILLASAGLCRLFMWLGGRYPAFSLVRGISLMLFVLLLVAGYVFVYVVCVMRFYQSMVRDEGYLTHTLPVTKGRLLFSKVFSSVVCLLLVLAADLLAVAAAFYQPGLAGTLFAVFKEALSSSGIGRWWIVLLLALLGMVSFLMLIFTGVSLGQLHNKNKLGFGVLYCFCGYMLNQLVSLVLLAALALHDRAFAVTFSGVAGCACGLNLLLMAAYAGVMLYIYRNRVNLE